MENVYKEFLNSDDFAILDYDEIIKQLEKLNITSICLSSRDYIGLENSVLVIEKTDSSHPLTIELDKYGMGSTLYINPDWYIEHKTQIDNLINYISLNAKGEKLYIFSSCLITPEVIDSLCANSNLKEVLLGSKDSVYSLSFEEYLKFKKSGIKKVETYAVDRELEENFDSLIDYNFSKKLISYYTHQDLSSDKEDEIYIYERITDEEIANLRYISPSKSIVLENDAIYDVVRVCNRLAYLGINCKVILQSKDKNVLNKILFNTEIQYDNLYVSPNFYPMKYKKYLELEKMLYLMVESAKNLSPFEKYIYAYGIAKRFKKYNEVPNNIDRSESRDLNFILENEYMVCVGFSNLFGDLLDKLGISNTHLDVGIDVSYDNSDVTEIKPVKKEGHERRYVHIVDPKYGIDGFYVSDPTWDNDMKSDTYNYLAVTDSEITQQRRYNFIDHFHDIFNVNNKEEFYEKINILLHKSQGSGFNLYKSKKNIVYYILKKIEILDLAFVNSLKEKYNYIGEESFKYPEDVTDLLSDIGDYLISKVNKPISGKTIFSAIETVYRTLKFYPEDRIDIELEKMRSDTKEKQEISFPKRSKEYPDGRVEEYDNYVNKFDVGDGVKTI